MAHAHVGASDAFFHHTAIKELADKISTSVNQLYREQRPDPALSKREKSRTRSSRFNDDGASSGASDGDGRQNEHWEDEEPEDDDSSVQCDGEDDDWDIEQSKAQVQQLLGSLHTDKRFDVMTKLNKWFCDKAKKVANDIELLVEMDDARNKNEDDLKKSQIEVNKELEEREMHSFQVLNKFYLVLNNLGKKGKEAQGTAKEKKMYSRKANFGTFERQQEENRNVQLESSIQDLRERLLSKETEMHKTAQHETKDKQPKASDLLQIISAQQEEMALLTTRIETNETRVKMLKAALDYVTCQHAAEPDQAVLDTIEEMKNQVREARMSDLIQSQDAEQRDMTVPDESELLKLENECVALRQQLQELEEQIREIEDPMTKMEGVFGEDQALTIENAPAAKSKLTAEVNKLQSENERLQGELQHYEELITQAEETLKIMEEQKVLFLENVAHARKNLAMVPLPTEDELRLPTEVVDNPADVELQEKHAQILESLKEEESALITEIESLEQLLTKARQRTADEKEKQKGLEAITAKQRKEYADIIAQLETEVPKSVEEEEALLQNLQQENNLLLAKMEDLQNKLESEDRRAKMDEEAAAQAEMLVRDEFQKKKEEIDAAINENQKEASPAGTPPEKQEPAVAESKDPQEAQLNELKKKQNQDIQELMKLQQENVELAKQIELIEMKIKAVKSNRGQPLDLSILKDTQAKDEDVPPENLELRKEVRKKQRELNALRKRWWSERQDPKTSARRNLVSNGVDEGVTSTQGDPPNEQFDKIKSAINEDA